MKKRFDGGAIMVLLRDMMTWMTLMMLMILMIMMIMTFIMLILLIPIVIRVATDTYCYYNCYGYDDYYD